MAQHMVCADKVALAKSVGFIFERIVSNWIHSVNPVRVSWFYRANGLGLTLRGLLMSRDSCRHWAGFAHCLVSAIYPDSSCVGCCEVWAVTRHAPLQWHAPTRKRKNFLSCLGTRVGHMQAPTWVVFAQKLCYLFSYMLMVLDCNFCPCFDD